MKCVYIYLPPFPTPAKSDSGTNWLTVMWWVHLSASGQMEAWSTRPRMQGAIIHAAFHHCTWMCPCSCRFLPGRRSDMHWSLCWFGSRVILFGLDYFGYPSIAYRSFIGGNFCFSHSWIIPYFRHFLLLIILAKGWLIIRPAPNVNTCEIGTNRGKTRRAKTLPAA